MISCKHHSDLHHSAEPVIKITEEVVVASASHFHITHLCRGGVGRARGPPGTGWLFCGAGLTRLQLVQCSWIPEGRGVCV
jgi:hypothetical protein